MTKKLSFVLLVMLAATNLFAQAYDPVAHLDSLLQRYDASEGSARLRAGRAVIDFCALHAEFFGDTLTLETRQTSPQQDLRVWYAAERYLIATSYFKEALHWIDKAEKAYKSQESHKPHEPHDTDLHCTLLCDRAYALYKTSDYAASVEAGQEAMRRCQQIGNTLQLSRAYLYLSLVNHALRKADEAMALAVKAIETNEKIPDNVQLHNTLGVACEIFCSAGEVEQAIAYGRRAVEEAHKHHLLPGIANHLTQLAYAYDRHGDYGLGLQAADSAIAIVQASQPIDRNQLALALEYKSWNLIDIGRHAEAADALHEAIRLEEAVGNTHAAWNNYRTLAEALEPTDPQGAIAALRHYIKLSDSIHTVQMKELMSQANAEFHNDELQEANARSQRLNLIIIVTALTIVLLLATGIGTLFFAFRQKKRTAEALEKLTVARESFFTNVTHEFRTPLTVILGIGKEMTTEGTLDSTELQHMGQTIERQGTRLLTLVNQLLDISKVKSAIGPQKLTEGDMASYVGMIMESLRENGRQKGVDVSYECRPQSIPARFTTDYLEKLVGNLVANAIKFTPEGGNVEVCLQAVGQQAILTVADTGCGIDAKDLPHLFEPFYQTEESDGQGSGVGLALVQQIVDALGGSISVESQLKRGTTFTVHLPLNTGHRSTTATPRTVPHDGRERELPVVLIVEDNTDVAHLIGHQLGEHYRKYYATNGEDGITQAQTLIPDLIITDLMMPKADGLQLCQALRHDPATSHIPLIIITAKATQEDRIRSLQAGADAYLYKPYNAAELLVRVEKLLEMRDILRQKYSTAATDTRPTDAPGTEASQHAEGSTEGTPSGNTDFAQHSTKFIETVNRCVLLLMPQGNCTVEQIATELCITPSQLRRKMHSITGMPPKKYISKVRMEYAHDLLHNHPEMKLVEIADRCGFSDLPHFIRLYKETYGITPAADSHKREGEKQETAP